MSKVDSWVTIGLAPDGLPAEMLPDAYVTSDGVLMARQSCALTAAGFLQGWIAARNTPQEEYYYEDDDTHIQDAVKAAIKLGVKRSFARRCARQIAGCSTSEAALREILTEWSELTAKRV